MSPAAQFENASSALSYVVRNNMTTICSDCYYYNNNSNNSNNNNNNKHNTSYYSNNGAGVYYPTTDDPLMFNDVTVFNNMTSLLTITPFWLDNSCQAFQFFLSTVVIGLLCVVGIACNMLTIVVLYRDIQNEVASFLLQVLALADSAVLLFSLGILSAVVGPSQIPAILKHLKASIPYLKAYIHPLGNTTHAVAVWMVVLLAVNRFIAVCMPFKAERYLTIRKAQIQVAVVIVLSIVVNIPRFFIFEIVYETNSQNETFAKNKLTAFGENSAVEIGYFNAFYTIVILIFPLICLVGFNAKLIYTLQVSMRNMQRNSLYYIGSQEKSITFVMIVIIIQLLVCHTPDRVITAVRQIAHMGVSNYNPVCPHPLIYAQHFANVLIIINCSSNFFIYCIFRERFRRIFCARFCPCFWKSSRGSNGARRRGISVSEWDYNSEPLVRSPRPSTVSRPSIRHTSDTGLLKWLNLQLGRETVGIDANSNCVMSRGNSVVDGAGNGVGNGVTYFDDGVTSVCNGVTRNGNGNGHAPLTPPSTPETRSEPFALQSMSVISQD